MIKNYYIHHLKYLSIKDKGFVRFSLKIVHGIGLLKNTGRDIQ